MTMMTQPSIPSSPEFRITDKLRDVIEEVVKTDDADKRLKTECQEIVDNHNDNGNGKDDTDKSTGNDIVYRGISIKLIREIVKSLKSHGKKIHLHELMEGSDLILQTPVTPPRNPELEARVQRLRVREENKEYKRMTQNVDPHQQAGGETFSFQAEVKSMNRQLTSVLNFVLTVVAGFAFGYKLVEVTYGPLLPMQMMCGLLIGTLVFFVDLYFMVRYTPI